METKVKVYSAFTPDTTFEVGTLTIYNDEVIRLDEHPNSTYFKDLDKDLLPIKRSKFAIDFIDKHNPFSKIFVANIKTGVFTFGVKELNQFQRFKLKWGLKLFWFQKDEYLRWVVTTFIVLLLGVASLLVTIYLKSK